MLSGAAFKKSLVLIYPAIAIVALVMGTFAHKAEMKKDAAGHIRQYTEYVKSKHADAGLTCATCHGARNAGNDPGHLRRPVTELCLGCHAGKIKDLMTHAPKAPAGATCATCHMPDGRHSFLAPKAAK